MKKLFFLILTIITITACKKNSNEPTPVPAAPIAVTYKFSANQNDAYTIRYIDSNYAVTTETIAGNNWSKSIKIAASANPDKLTLYVESANKSFDASGYLSVAVDGQFPVVLGIASSADTYGLRGQIIYYISNP